MKIKYTIIGAVAGFLNGLFGAGGGSLLVPMLKKLKIKTRKVHATSVAIIFCVSLFSFSCYVIKGYIDFKQLFFYGCPGVIGSVVGGLILKNIKSSWLHKIFGVFIILSGIRMFFS